MSKRILYLGLNPSHYQAQTTHEVVHWPIIQIKPRLLTEPALQRTLLAFPNYSHVIVTSKSTVMILQEYLPRLGISLQIWSTKITLAVGQVTAKYLKECGIHAIIPLEETAEGVIHELQQLPLTQAYIFWPHSSQARPVIKDFLDHQGICHQTCILYDSLPHLPGERPALDTFDEIVFTSPSTIAAFLEIFGQFPPHLHFTSIGPITARYLEARQREGSSPRTSGRKHLNSSQSPE